MPSTRISSPFFEAKCRPNRHYVIVVFPANEGADLDFTWRGMWESLVLIELNGDEIQKKTPTNHLLLID